ncbi:MAG: acyltransferase [Woeseiaceae bacterium]|nr:acyltransferase [Woeseiaceae bacterium]
MLRIEGLAITAMETSNNNPKQAGSGRTSNHYLPALTGIRFFAIFHIFLFHLWAMYRSEKPEEMASVLMGFDNVPKTLGVFMSNGWISTSLFFLLSGFILSYLYWGDDGQLTIGRRRFWLQRFARIYPIHLIVMAILISMQGSWHLSQGVPLSTLVPSALATLALVQAWVPPWIPQWSWPTWTISALVFLYLVTPWLMTALSRLSARQATIALAAMPFISAIPAIVYLARWASDAPYSMNVDMFFANLPLFWVPYFVAGMLMTRVFALSRFKPAPRSPSWFARGDVAFIVVIAIGCVSGIEQHMKFLIRHLVLMPLFIVMLLDLARGRGLMAKVFSLPGTGFLGETGYSIFIWQGFVLMMMFGTLVINPDIGPYQVWIAIGLIMALAIPSTYLIEKPISRAIRRRFIRVSDTSTP